MAKEASPPHPDFRFHRVVACRPRAVHGDAQFYLSSNSRAMSALGQKQTFHSAIVMSALPPKADMRGAKKQMWLWAKSDITTHSIASPAFNFRDDSSPARFRIECDLLTFCDLFDALGARKLEH